MKTIIQLPNTNSNYSYQELTRRVHYLEKTISSFMAQQVILPVKTIEGVLFVRSVNIFYIQADSNYATIFQKDQKKIVVSKTLKYIENQLPASFFIRVHQSYLVNIYEIDRCLHGSTKILILKSGKEIPVSKKYYPKLIEKLGS